MFFWPLTMTHRSFLTIESDSSRFYWLLGFMVFWPLMMTHRCFFDLWRSLIDLFWPLNVTHRVFIDFWGSCFFDLCWWLIDVFLTFADDGSMFFWPLKVTHRGFIDFWGSCFFDLWPLTLTHTYKLIFFHKTLPTVEGIYVRWVLSTLANSNTLYYRNVEATLVSTAALFISMKFAFKHREKRT